MSKRRQFHGARSVQEMSRWKNQRDGQMENDLSCFSVLIGAAPKHQAFFFHSLCEKVLMLLIVLLSKFGSWAMLLLLLIPLNKGYCSFIGVFGDRLTCAKWLFNIINAWTKSTKLKLKKKIKFTHYRPIYMINALWYTSEWKNNKTNKIVRNVTLPTSINLKSLIDILPGIYQWISFYPITYAWINEIFNN